MSSSVRSCACVLVLVGLSVRACACACDRACMRAYSTPALALPSRCALKRAVKLARLWSIEHLYTLLNFPFHLTGVRTKGLSGPQYGNPLRDRAMWAVVVGGCGGGWESLTLIQTIRAWVSLSWRRNMRQTLARNASRFNGDQGITPTSLVWASKN